MKHFIRYAAMGILPLFFFLLSFNAKAQVGIGTPTPDASAMLEVNSSDKGLLVPRIALTAASVAAPVASPATGLLIYNTATSGTAPDQVTPGFYYWNGSRWYPVVNKGNNPGDMQYWDGSKWLMIPAATADGKVLTWCSGKPKWGPCVESLEAAPVNNQFEGQISNFFPAVFQPGADQLTAIQWTSGGNPVTLRSLLKFDYTGVPAGITIDSARLLLFADLNPVNGNLVDAHFGPTNSFTIKRITSVWTTPSQFTWNSPPAVTNTNQAIVPQSTSSFQDAVINVTDMVQDQLNNGNNGFLLNLVTEVQFNSRQYSSSKEPNLTRIPRIRIYWH
jgi:hypothetical protein